MKKFVNFLNLSRQDLVLIIMLYVLAVLITAYPYPLLTASMVILTILAIRITERITGKKQADSGQPSEEIIQTRIQPVKQPNESHVTPEQRSAEEIIMTKLKGGAIEKAIDEKFDKMVNSVIDDLFGNYGDITRDLQKKLRENMSPYIENYDYSQYHTKLEHLLNELVKAVTGNEKHIIQNVRTLMGLEPVEEIKATELFEKYMDYIAANVDTSKLEVNTNDEPSYEPLTAIMEVEHHRDGIYRDEQVIRFSCEEDESLNMTLHIYRWRDSVIDNDWRIDKIKRTTDSGEIAYAFQTKSDKDITELEVPITNLRHLDDFEVYLLKLHYDNTKVILDETFAEVDDVEVDAEPEFTLS